MTADLSALIARLEAAEVGSRELDFAIHRAITGENMGFATPDVSRSLDTALALAERVLDNNVEWSASRTNSGGHTAAVLVGALGGSGQADTPALALCIAILRAKQGEGE